MYTPAIVTIAYNRPDSLRRLLKSIGDATYPVDRNIPLIISIDKSDSDEVIKVANDFTWNYGSKIIMAREERMGLKAHVLSCGDLSEEYGSVIILEDDLFVSPAFYLFALKALDFTEKEDKVGSISLYNHLFNVHARKSFAAIDDGFDNWYFQIASSWGQVYSKEHWKAFKCWYEENKDKSLVRCDVPANVSSWSDKSWLKYYITYLIDTDKYCFYPRISYTTNFGEAGSHAIKADDDLQVPIAGRTKAMYCSFSKVSQSGAVYDAFFENVTLNVPKDTIVDLYGIKPIDEIMKTNDNIRYVLTIKSLPYNIVRSYGRRMRPVDANIVYNVTGNDYHLYDMTIKAVAHKDDDEAISFLYEYRGISAKQMAKMIKYRVSEKLKK